MDFRQPSMLDFTNKSRGPSKGFSLDKRDLVRRSQMRRREWRAVVMLPVAVVAVALFIHFVLKMGNVDPQISASSEALAGQTPLAPMARPDLERAPALPPAAEVDAALVLPNPSLIGGLDAANLRWARDAVAADQRSPPIPQRLGARDLVQSPPRPGLPAMVTGRLEDTAAAPLGDAPGWQRLLLAIDEGQYVEALAPADADLVIGSTVQVVGRFVGFDRLPAADAAAAAEVDLPVLVARIVRRAETEAADPSTSEWSGAAPSTLPANLFDDVDDERTYVETRPYYHLLGRVRLEQGTAAVEGEVVDLNQRGNDVHRDPDAFRGKAVTVRGKVFRAWEDAQVAQDRPFGIERVQRILVYATDFGPITEVIDGKEITRDRPVRRLFELAVIGPQPAPMVGDVVTVRGRFLKFHAIPVPTNRERDRANRVERQSGNAYLYFIVAPGFVGEPPPPPYSFAGLEIAIAATVIVLGVVFWRVSRRERAAADGIASRARQIRRSRFELATRPRAPGTPGDPPPAAVTPPAGPGDPPPPGAT